MNLLAVSQSKSGTAVTFLVISVFPRGFYGRKKHTMSAWLKRNLRGLCRREPVTLSVVLLKLVQAEEVDVRGGVRQAVQRVRLKAIAQPGGR